MLKLGALVSCDAARCQRSNAELIVGQQGADLVAIKKDHKQAVELVQDNLNTHSYGSFYEHLPAEQARALAQKINFHFTPRLGS